jgi:toxin ParE1/3/4
VLQADRLAEAPHRGPIHPDLAPGLRHLTLERAISCFHVGDGPEAPVRVLAVLFGGQDHQRRKRRRLLSEV